MRRLPAQLNGIGNAAVKKATGRTWTEWMRLLEKTPARRWPQAELARWLRQQQRLSDWWCQMIAAGYEQAIGRRVKNSKAAGFEISVSRTIAAPVARAFEAWKDAAIRERWLPGAVLTIRKATPHKSIRITWADDTSVAVNFWPKGPLKCEVVPQHGALRSADLAERMKAYWAERLEALRALIEVPPARHSPVTP